MKKHELKLLTSFVDGEIHPSMIGELNELLTQSPEARGLLALLKQDALMIRNQVPMECSFELTQKILAKIKERPVSRVARFNTNDGLTLKPWLSLMVVTSILAFTTFISFYSINVFLGMRQIEKSGSVDSVADAKDAGGAEGKFFEIPGSNNDSGSSNRLALNEKANILPIPPDSSGKDSNSSESRNIPAVKINELAGGNNGKDLLAAPANDTIKLIKVDPTLPWMLRKKDIDGELNGRLLSRVIGQDARIKIELSCKDNLAAFTQLKFNLNKMGYFVYSDVTTLMRLKNKNDKSAVNYMIYLENPSINEIAQLISQEKEKSTATKDAPKIPTLFWDAMVVSKLSPSDRKTIKSVLGFEPMDQGNSNSNGPINKSPEVPDSSRIGSQNSQKNKGPVFALSFTPNQSLANNPELKQYMDTFKPANSAGIKVLLVLRSEN